MLHISPSSSCEDTTFYTICSSCEDTIYEFPHLAFSEIDTSAAMNLNLFTRAPGGILLSQNIIHIYICTIPALLYCIPPLCILQYDIPPPVYYNILNPLYTMISHPSVYYNIPPICILLYPTPLYIKISSPSVYY